MAAITNVPTAGDLRAARARAQVPLYLLAARVEVHPVRLGGLLSGRIPLQPDMAERIAAAIEAVATE
jgi:hypothetical protein